jgi:5-formyltetrahydrofolate cyclo-ligase
MGGFSHAPGYRAGVGRAPSPNTPDAPTGAAASDKQAWRAWARAVRHAWASDTQRRQREEAALQAALQAPLLASQEWRAAQTVLTYLPFGEEVAPLALTVRDDGTLSQVPSAPTLAVTRTPAPGTTLTIHPLRPPLERHPFGFWQPPANAPTLAAGEVDLVLVPGLAFDARGARLGYGRGLYDRLLARLKPDTPRVGVTIDALWVQELPSEPHDVRMTHVLTPKGLFVLD